MEKTEMMKAFLVNGGNIPPSISVVKCHSMTDKMVYFGDGSKCRFRKTCNFTYFPDFESAKTEAMRLAKESIAWRNERVSNDTKHIGELEAFLARIAVYQLPEQILEDVK